MNRCKTPFSASRRLCAAALLAMAAATAGSALAQDAPLGETRNFPPEAQFGELQVSNFPEVTLNGETIRTTPGFRLFSPERTLVFASNYQGQKLAVGYVIEQQTQWLHTAWILTPAEVEKYKPMSTKPGLLRSLFGF